MSNRLDLDQARCFVRPDHGPICLQRLGAEDTSRQSLRVKQYFPFLPSDKIEIGYGPEPTYLVNPGDNLNLGVDATTDPTMKDKINYEWHWVNKDGVDEKLPSAEYPDVFHVSLDGKNMTVMVPDIDENDPESYKKYNAIVNKEFYLIVGHDYETVRVNFTVNGVEAVPPGMITLVLIIIISPEVEGCSIFSNSIFSYFFIGQGNKKY